MHVIVCSSRHEAELARQAELERQRKKAMEIEKEREEQMKKLAKKREEEEREMELKRKAEWARKRRAELEGQRDWEKKHLYTLRVQHSRLEDELRQLDQKKLGVLSSIERQKGNQGQIAMTLKSMRVSHDVRRAEITKLQTELNVSSISHCVMSHVGGLGSVLAFFSSFFIPSLL